MKLLHKIIFYSCLITPIQALAGNIEPGWYLSGGARASKPTKGFSGNNKAKEVKHSMSSVLNLQAGYKINRFLRADINAQYRRIRMRDDIYKRLKTSGTSLMMNIYLDGNNYSPATPYITAGFGVTSLNAHSKTTTTSIREFKNSHSLHKSFNVGAGVQIQVLDNFGVDVEYRYVDLGILKFIGVKSEDSRKMSLAAHEVLFNIIVLL